RVTEGKRPVSDAVSTKNVLIVKEKERMVGMMSCKAVFPCYRRQEARQRRCKHEKRATAREKE
ncbi:hypothetical protein, partial [Paenibacillus sp. N3.4]|uniref:hypothetical protein n=1 Tax=Paenibacillus sp. N3.4 TaxID=2603222 RepID=UPI001C9D40CB